MNRYYFITDLAEYIVKGGLLACLLYGLVPVKNYFRGYEKWVAAIVAVQYAVFYLALSYYVPFRGLFYEHLDVPVSSRQSIFPLAVSMVLTFLICFCLYSGSKIRIFYLIFIYYTVRDLIMFTFHAIFVAILSGITAWMSYLVIDGNDWLLQHYMAVLDMVMVLWNLCFQILMVFLIAVCVRYVKKNLPPEDNTFTMVRQLFLMVPEVMGFGLVVMLRSIFYEADEVHIALITDEHPETNVLIPLVTGLCILCILFSTYLLNKLIEYHQKETLVEIYQNRIGDMEEHMKDVEHLYDGIRGMRHDMKNYVADLEVLLQDNSVGQEIREKEINRYLDGICSTLEELEMKCNTGNLVTDVVISRKMRTAAEKGIDFETDFIFSDHMGISAFDVSIILNNGLDNALEAAQNEEKRYIHLGSYIRENIFFIEIRNGFTGVLKKDITGENLCTSKEEAGHGLGMKNIISCAEKYYGKAQWSVKDKEFILVIMLQGRRQKDERLWN